MEENPLRKSIYHPSMTNIYFMEEVGRYLQKKGINTIDDLEKLFEPSYFVILPIDILERPDISSTSKILYGEITALSRKSKVCFATNDFLAHRLGTGERTITRSVQELAKKGLITLKITRTSKGTFRKIHINWVPTSQSGEGGSPKWRGGVAKVASQKRNKKKRNKKNNNTEQSSGIEIAEVIKLFEVINPACKNYYGNTNQRKAADDLIASHGFDRIKSVVSQTLPKTNRIAYLPTITTPIQLRDKWSSLEAGIYKMKNKEDRPQKVGRGLA